MTHLYKNIILCKKMWYTNGWTHIVHYVYKMSMSTHIYFSCKFQFSHNHFLSFVKIQLQLLYWFKCEMQLLTPVSVSKMIQCPNHVFWETCSVILTIHLDIIKHLNDVQSIIIVYNTKEFWWNNTNLLTLSN